MRLITPIITLILLITTLGGVFLFVKKPLDYVAPQDPSIKIFQIGFNKCGTTTLHHFFSANGIKSLHHDQGKLATTIFTNYKTRKKLLSPEYEFYTAFFDMENIYHSPELYVYLELFKELDQQYPGSKFILATRNKDAWLRSRARHETRSGRTYLEVVAAKQQLSKQQVVALWDQQWDRHHQAVLEYFKDRPNDLLVFDIEQDDPKKIAAFFKDVVKLNPKLYRKVDPYKKRPMKPVKIFQIGFNKCGTTSLAEFFNSNKIASVHYDDGKLATLMWLNHRHNLPLIPNKYANFQGFFDMQNIHANPPIFIAQRLFKDLDQQYPGSKFILNIRDKNAWIRSRSRHKTVYGDTYLGLTARQYKKTEPEVLSMWSKEWDEHIAAVKEYFKDRPDDLLIFDIEHDGPEKLRNFFIENYALDLKKYLHKNKTATGL
jgi:hypothetical protein